jgi:L-iditol 2-dehydrogenase
MKALVKFASGDGNLDVLEVEEPECGPNNVKLKIAYCGVCGTDLHVLHDSFRNYPPVILGHEFAGEVVEVGQGVDPNLLGRRMAGLGASSVTCGKCAFCKIGRFIFCKSRRGMGHGVNGAFARFAVLRPDQLFEVPRNCSMRAAALTEPFAAAVQAVTEVSPVQIGDFALISGPGPIGLLCLKLLVAQGVQTIVAGTARDKERLDASKRLGAIATVDVSKDSIAEIAAECTKGAGVDVAFECAGHPGSVRGCLQSLRPMGHYTQVAICGTEIEFPMDLVFYRQLTISGSVCYTESTWRRSMEILAEGRVQLEDLVSAEFPISKWRDAFDMCANRQGIKILLYPI